MIINLSNKVIAKEQMLQETCNAYMQNALVLLDNASFAVRAAIHVGASGNPMQSSGSKLFSSLDLIFLPIESN